jgi:hypothetical protein
MHVFPKGTEEMHGHIFGMLCQSPLSDTMFGSVCISGFPKSTDDCYAHAIKT